MGALPPPRAEHVISGKRSAAFAWNESNYVEREQDAKPKHTECAKRRNLPGYFQIHLFLIIASPSPWGGATNEVNGGGGGQGRICFHGVQEF